MSLCFFDTNILLYSISTTPADQAKRERSIALLDIDDGALSVQVLQEFYVQATRTARKSGLSHAIALGLIESWMRFKMQDMSVPVMRHALEICRRYKFSYWDSAIIAAACALGCEIVFTEDLQHGREIEGVTIRNPFV